MKVYHLTTIGEFHTHHNEDCLTICEIGQDKHLIAVMDGCSMGTESHFASTLIAKILRKTAKEISFKAFAEKRENTVSQDLKQVAQALFNELKFVKSRWMLESTEILSTLMLAIVHQQEKTAEILTIGDGLICCNGKYTEYEQGDKPDYLGYHLAEKFDDWFDAQTQQLSIKNIRDLSIATDGIFTFKNFDNHDYQSISGEEIIDFLLIDKPKEYAENMLHKKLLHIEKRWGLKPSDDLSIIRVIDDSILI